MSTSGSSAAMGGGGSRRGREKAEVEIGYNRQSHPITYKGGNTKGRTVRMWKEKGGSVKPMGLFDGLDEWVPNGVRERPKMFQPLKGGRC